MPRYFFGENAARPLVAGGERFTFTITGMIAGAVQGVVEIPDDKVSLVMNKGLTEITHEAYEEAVQKRTKRPYVTVSVNTELPQDPTMKTPLLTRSIKPTVRPATVVDGNTLPHGDAAKDNLPLSIDDAVDLGTAAPPPAEIPKATSRRKAKQ